MTNFEQTNSRGQTASPRHKIGIGQLKQAAMKFVWFLIRGGTSLNRSGMDGRVWLRALVITAIFFGVLNTWLMWSVERNYHNAVLLEINEARSTEEAVQVAIDQIGAEPSMADIPGVKEAFRERSDSKTAREYLLGIIGSVQGKVSPTIETTLDEQMTGNLRGSRFLYLASDGVTGPGVIDALKQADPTWSHKTALLDDPGSQTRSEEADVFLAKFIDHTALENRPALRNLMRFNGWIQWLTVCTCIVVLLLVLKRATLLAQLVEDGWFRETESSRTTRLLSACGSEEFLPPETENATAFIKNDSVDPMLDRQVYPTFEFLVALLPSLGFIGTVLGMGDALLSADSLFSAEDKSLAISTITSHLGFAFDTTLMGLITGIVAGAAVLRLRLWESLLWQRAEPRK